MRIGCWGRYLDPRR